MNASRLAAALLGSGFATLAPVTAEAQSLCQSLEQISSKAGAWQDLAGKPETEDSWQGKISAPGFERCRVSRRNGALDYECEIRQTDAASSFAAAKEIGRSIIADCKAENISILQNDLDRQAAQGSKFYIDSLLSLSAHDAIGTVGAEAMPTLLPSGENGTAYRTVLRFFRMSEEAAPVGAPSLPPPNAPRKRYESSQKIFCDCLTRLDTEATKRFEGILGESKDEGRWESLFRMPGAESCYISTYSSGERYYSCRMFETSSREEAEAAVETMSKLSKSCLGPSLTFIRKERDDGGYRLSGTRAGDVRPDIEIRLRASDNWVVSFDVEQMN